MYSVSKVILTPCTLLILFKKILPQFNIAFTLLAYVKRNNLWYLIPIFLPTINEGRTQLNKKKIPVYRMNH